MRCKNIDNQTLISSIHNNLHHTPEIILNPYIQLINLLENDEVYGALLKLKDLFELNIKLPLVILLSYINQKTSNLSNDTDFKTEFTALHDTLQAFTKDTITYKLSLGHWQSIAAAIKKIPSDQLFPNTQYSNILKSLYEINKLNHQAYTSQKSNERFISIANWRNETIGHGALNCNKEEVKQDILEKLNILNNILQANDTLYSNLKVEISGDNLSVNDIKITPFIELVDTNQFCIFESYNTKKKLGHSINYSKGYKSPSQKLSSNLSKIDSSVRECERVLGTSSKGKRSICDDTIYSKDIKSLLDLDYNVFYQGHYFSDWFINTINTYPGGVFLCCAERGMGKSAFSRTLSQLSNIKIKNNSKLSKFRDDNPEVVIRTFHFNSYFNSNSITFLTKIKELFTSELKIEDNGNAYTQNITYSSIPVEEALDNLKYSFFSETQDIFDVKEKFIIFLQTLLNIWKEAYGTEKLILVLDGIDEIKIGDKNIKIFDIIPTITEIDNLDIQNIYIVLTSRCAKELSNNIKIRDFIVPENFTSYLELKRELNSANPSSPYSLCYLNDIKLHFRELNGINVITLANTLEWRYNYLTAYKKIYGLHSTKNLNDFINDPFNIYIEHLDYLCKDYSNDIQSILNLLVITNEPLTINEISYLLTGDNNPSFKLLGQITDIQNFLTIERNDERGTLYNLSHEEWVQKIFTNKRLEINRKNLKIHLGNLLTNVLTNYETINFADTDFDGELWLISNFDRINFTQLNLLKKIDKRSFGNQKYQFTRRKYFQEAYGKISRTKYNTDHKEAVSLSKSASTNGLFVNILGGLGSGCATRAITGLGAILTKTSDTFILPSIPTTVVGAATVGMAAVSAAAKIFGTFSEKKEEKINSGKSDSKPENPLFDYLLHDNFDDTYLDKLEAYNQYTNNETPDNIKYQLNNLVDCIDASIQDGDIKEAYKYILELMDTYECYKDEYDYCCHYIFRGAQIFLKAIEHKKVSHFHKNICNSLTNITNSETSRVNRYIAADKKLPYTAFLNAKAYQAYLQNKCAKLLSFHKPEEAFTHGNKSVTLIEDILSNLDKKNDAEAVQYQRFIFRLAIEHKYTLDNINFLKSKNSFY